MLKRRKCIPLKNAHARCTDLRTGIRSGRSGTALSVKALLRVKSRAKLPVESSDAFLRLRRARSILEGE